MGPLELPWPPGEGRCSGCSRPTQGWSGCPFAGPGGSDTWFRLGRVTARRQEGVRGLMGSWECKRKSDAWSWAGGPGMPSFHLKHGAASQSRPLLLASLLGGGAGHGFLAEPRESRWLSLEEAQTEKLSEGITWEVWGGPWPGKSEQRAAQTEPGDARPPTGLLLPTASRARGATPDPQPALPAPALPPPPGPAPLVERVTSGFRDGWCWAIGLLVHGRRWLGPICLAPVYAPHMPEFLSAPGCGMTCTPRGGPAIL